MKCIIYNADVQAAVPVSYSTDGYEETFATNCLRHLLLVNLLRIAVLPDGRIVSTSGTRDPANWDGQPVGAGVELDPHALAYQGKHPEPISGGRRYSMSKLCIILSVYERSRQLQWAGRATSSIAYDCGR